MKSAMSSESEDRGPHDCRGLQQKRTTAAEGAPRRVITRGVDVQTLSSARSAAVGDLQAPDTMYDLVITARLTQRRQPR